MKVLSIGLPVTTTLPVFGATVTITGVVVLDRSTNVVAEEAIGVWTTNVPLVCATGGPVTMTFWKAVSVVAVTVTGTATLLTLTLLIAGVTVMVSPVSVSGL